MVKVIIFDLGGVILKHSSTLIAEILSELFSISQEEALGYWNQARVKLLKGELSSQELLSNLKSRVGSSYSLEELSKLWEELYTKKATIDSEVLEFIEELGKNHKVYLLTDTIDIHDEYNKKRGIYDKFSGVFKSFEMSLAKAQGKEIYLETLKKIHAQAQECVFIDDMEEQIKVAESVGAKGIVYKNLPQLKAELSKIEITT